MKIFLRPNKQTNSLFGPYKQNLIIDSIAVLYEQLKIFVRNFSKMIAGPLKVV